MNDTDICPACLSEIPAGYPHDHVAIDRAAAGDRALFAAMDGDGRREVVITALARRTGLLGLSVLLNWPMGDLQGLLPDEHPQSRATEMRELEQLIRRLWGQGVTDTVISAEAGCSPNKIGRIRKRLSLPTRRRSSAERKAVWAV